MNLHLGRLVRTVACAATALTLAQTDVHAQQPPATFGGEYSALDGRRQQLVMDWVRRFTELTGQKLDAPPFYDEMISLSGKTTFEAVTHALMTTSLTDEKGAPMGDALSIVERVESVRGEVQGAAGDRQFRMYVRLKEDGIDRLERSTQFKRGMDNSVYHRGYPINYRQQGGTPSIQVSLALDRRRADIDVDYRASAFPVSLFNGHLTAANSDVRAGGNSDRHVNRWTGFQNWWRGFFGINLDRATEIPALDSTLVLPKVPRIGKENADVSAYDFLSAWLIEGDAVAAMGYVSDRAYACIAQEREDPSDFDRGLAPFELLMNLKATSNTLGPHATLEGLTVGVRLTTPGLRVVKQPHHAQFVMYAVPDDIAAQFDCQSRLAPATSKNIPRAYGNYFGATFYVNGRQDDMVALLWAREDGYWKIVSWQTGSERDPVAAPAPPPSSRPVRIKADASFERAARSFLETWLVRKDYDAAFRTLSERSYACFNLIRHPQEPAAASMDEAARKLRAGIERTGEGAGRRSLDDMLMAVEPFHSDIRVMDHAKAQTYTLSSIPRAIGQAAECAARVNDVVMPLDVPLEYGQNFGLSVRFRTASGETPVLRLLWEREDVAWRITVVDVEMP
jgi:hypothetical protein